MTETSFAEVRPLHASWLWPTGRTMIALLFAISGVMKLVFAGGVAQAIASKGLPYPEPLAYLTGAFEIASAISLISGRLLAPTAILLAVYTLVAAVLFHNFWAFQGQAQQDQLFNFLKNIALAGALLVVVDVARAND